MTVQSPRDAEVGGIFGRGHLWVSIGMCALILLTAFEALAVTTIMPAVSAQLHGAQLYALAFSAPLAISIVGMVAAGNWCDRRGPRGPLFACVGLFVVGLVVVGAAPTMAVLVSGRLVQGLGAGGLTVALYVIVARVYPPALQLRVFAAFSAAWVVPSLIGPLIAGLVAERFGWRWVFLGVIVLVVLAMGMVVPAMRSLAGSGHTPAPPWSIGRIAWSTVASVAVLAVNVSASVHGPLRWVAPPVAIVVVFVALRPLLPAGALRARHGLPSVVLVRGLLAGSFFATEIYVPYLLTRQYAFTVAGAGLALTVAGLMWAAASGLQSRMEPRVSGTATFRIGSAMLALAIASALATAALVLAPGTMIVGWALAGAGMGFMYPRTSVMMLGYSTVRDQGFNSAGLAIADSIGAAVAIAATALIFTALPSSPQGVPFAGCFALTTALACAAFWAGDRVGAGRPAAAAPAREGV